MLNLISLITQEVICLDLKVICIDVFSKNKIILFYEYVEMEVILLFYVYKFSIIAKGIKIHI